MFATFTLKNPWTVGREDGRLPTITVLAEEATEHVSLQFSVPDDRFQPSGFRTDTLFLKPSLARAIASAIMGAAAEIR